MLKRLLISTVFVVAAPALALAARGYATTDVNMRAGPGTDYPVVDTIPTDARVNIHGCLSDGAWCDVSWNGDRGWVDANYLDYYYNNRYVYLPDYYNVIGVPLATFSLPTYWGEYYAGEPWYGQLGYWQGFWQSHGRYGYVTQGRGARFARSETAPEQGQAFAGRFPRGEHRQELGRFGRGAPMAAVHGAPAHAFTGRPGEEHIPSAHIAIPRANVGHFALQHAGGGHLAMQHGNVGHLVMPHIAAAHAHFAGAAANLARGPAAGAFARVGHAPAAVHVGGAPHPGGAGPHGAGGPHHR
jgi:uncharacterized protein YraI